jgi:hypothetical protein
MRERERADGDHDDADGIHSFSWGQFFCEVRFGCSKCLINDCAVRGDESEQQREKRVICV